MIDLHAHPLPGVDDGPSGREQALALAAAAADAGTRVMAATPHIDHRWRVDPAQVPGRVRELNEHLARAEVELTVVQGGEIAASRLGELDAAALDAVRLGDGPYLLIECPHSSAGAAFAMMVFEALARGERVVLGHPERSPVFARDLEGLERLVLSGALCSITAGSLTGRFGQSARRLALRMLAEGLVHDVASDAHDADGRPPALVEGMRAAEDDLPGMIEQASWYLEAAPKAILAGDPLPPRPDPPPLRRRLLGRLGLRRA